MASPPPPQPPAAAASDHGGGGGGGVGVDALTAAQAAAALGAAAEIAGTSADAGPSDAAGVDVVPLRRARTVARPPRSQLQSVWSVAAEDTSSEEELDDGGVINLPAPSDFPLPMVGPADGSELGGSDVVLDVAGAGGHTTDDGSREDLDHDDSDAEDADDEAEDEVKLRGGLDEEARISRGTPPPAGSTAARRNAEVALNDINAFTDPSSGACHSDASLPGSHRSQLDLPRGGTSSSVAVPPALAIPPSVVAALNARRASVAASQLSSRSDKALAGATAALAGGASAPGSSEPPPRTGTAPPMLAQLKRGSLANLGFRRGSLNVPPAERPSAADVNASSGAFPRPLEGFSGVGGQAC